LPFSERGTSQNFVPSSMPMGKKKRQEEGGTGLFELLGRHDSLQSLNTAVDGRGKGKKKRGGGEALRVPIFEGGWRELGKRSCKSMNAERETPQQEGGKKGFRLLYCFREGGKRPGNGEKGVHCPRASGLFVATKKTGRVVFDLPLKGFSQAGQRQTRGGRGEGKERRRNLRRLVSRSPTRRRKSISLGLPKISAP